MDPHNSLISQVEGARGRMGRRLCTEETLVSDSAANRGIWRRVDTLVTLSPFAFIVPLLTSQLFSDYVLFPIKR